MTWVEWSQSGLMDVLRDGGFHRSWYLFVWQICSQFNLTIKVETFSSCALGIESRISGFLYIAKIVHQSQIPCWMLKTQLI